MMMMIDDDNDDNDSDDYEDYHEVPINLITMTTWRCDNNQVTIIIMAMISSETTVIKIGKELASDEHDDH